jgi:GTP1/Obg family GTP-binding protein
MSKPKPNTKETPQELLEERQSTHGDFTDNARVSQALKNILRNDPHWDRLHDIHKEAIEYICGKISRILAGDPTFDDNYDDIAGYAQLPKKFNHGK